MNAGETADITVTVKHLGGVALTDVTTTIESADSYITITDNTGYFGYIEVDSIKENTNDPYVVSVASSVPQGHTAPFKVIATDAGFADTLDFELVIDAYDYLVWNPDMTPLSGHIIDSILVDLGYSGIHTMTLPSTNLLAHRALFICLGIYPQKHIVYDTSYEASLVSDYLNSGGCVYLEGGDVWFFDPYYYSGYDFGPWFGIEGVSDGSNDMGPVIGMAGTFTEQMIFDYDGENTYMDQISPVGTGYVIFRDSMPGYDCGIANDVVTYKTVGTSFELGSLVDGSGVSTRAALLDSIMHFFGIYPTGVEESTDADVVVPTFEIRPSIFRDRMNISYSIVHSAKDITLKVFDVMGRLVKNFSLSATEASIVWNGTDSRGLRLPAGIYLIQLETENSRLVQKAVFVE